MGNTDRQLDNIAQKLDAVGRQVQDVSEKVEDVWIAQQGNDVIGAEGLMYRVGVLENKVDEMKTQHETWTTQMRFMRWLFGGGSIGGFIALILMLIQLLR